MDGELAVLRVRKRKYVQCPPNARKGTERGRFDVVTAGTILPENASGEKKRVFFFTIIIVKKIPSF